MDAKFFGATLKKLREDRNWTQADLAEQSGVGQSTIARIETGERLPNWETVLALCLALDVSCEVFRPPQPKK